MDILFPIGRLVGGSLYKPFEKDDKKPDWFIACAIRKNGESHWNQTEWGTKIFQIASAGFPHGQTNNPNFAWKIEDGDSQIPKLLKDGKTLMKPCDREGYSGHWILKFSSGFAPVLCDDQGKILTLPEDSVKTGDFIQVFAQKVKANGSNQSPGIYLNHSHVAFIAYGERIALSTSVDPTTIGFGGALPAGASKTPISSGFNPAVAVAPAPAPAPIPVPVAAPPAYAAILKPKIMTAKANGATYEAFIQQGWTDEGLIQHGYLQA